MLARGGSRRRQGHSGYYRAVEFWCGRLGLQLLHRGTETDPDIASLIGEDSVELVIADLDVGDGRIIELIKYTRPAGRPVRARSSDPGSTHIALRVDDLGAALERSRARKRARYSATLCCCTTRVAPGTAPPAVISLTRTGSSSSSSSGPEPRRHDHYDAVSRRPEVPPPNPVDPCSSSPTAEAGRPPPTGDAIAATAGVPLDRHALLAMAKATSAGYIPIPPAISFAVRSRRSCS